MSKRFMMVKLAAVIVAAASLGMANAADKAPIRLGFLTIKSGALAAGGKQMQDGLNLFLKQRNNMIAGRKVELFVGDTAGQPAVTKTRACSLYATLPTASSFRASDPLVTSAVRTPRFCCTRGLMVTLPSSPAPSA